MITVKACGVQLPSSSVALALPPIARTAAAVHVYAIKVAGWIDASR
jgi:hypothetical protein